MVELIIPYYALKWRWLPVRFSDKLRRSVLVVTSAVLAAAILAAALYAGLVWPSADGKKTYKDSGLVVDASHAESGYIMVKGPKSKKRLKLRIVKGDITMTYDLNQNGKYEVFPLQMGSGSYSVTLYQNASGKKYSQVGKTKFKTELTDELAAYLCPNQYVDYTPGSKAVALSDKICSGKNTPKERYSAIREYIKGNYVYDYIRATTLKSGELPDMDYVIDKKMGVCQDLAALACCMLRVQGIPTEFVVGYANKTYHAWCVVHLDGETILYDPTADCNGIPKNAKYTVERYY